MRLTRGTIIVMAGSVVVAVAGLLAGMNVIEKGKTPIKSPWSPL